MGPKRYPGKIVLFGSGEIAASGRAIHERLLNDLAPPLPITILESPAGFQPNSSLVAEEIKAFFEARLPNHRPQVSVVPVRRREQAEDTALLEPLRGSRYIFMGPGSPTYAVRVLKDTLAWRRVCEMHEAGAYLCLASAGTLAVSAKVLPVYEIYKAGSDLHWSEGLDLFGRYGLELAFLPHWDNHEGGAKLDTSRCFMGEDRFQALKALLPKATRILGIDEHTALIFDFERQRCVVFGKGSVSLYSGEGESRYASSEEFAFNELGPYFLPEPSPELGPSSDGQPAILPPEVEFLIAQREEARGKGEWARADALRAQAGALGFELMDTKDGVRWRQVRPA